MHLSIPKVSISQIKAARALCLVGHKTSYLRRRILLPTISNWSLAEGWLAGRRSTGDKIRAAIEKAGIEFIHENGGGPGVRLRKRQRLMKAR